MNDSELIIYKKPPKGEDGHKTFSIRVKDSIVSQIDDISSQTGRTRNELISILLEYALNNYTIRDYSKK